MLLSVLKVGKIRFCPWFSFVSSSILLRPLASGEYLQLSVSISPCFKLGNLPKNRPDALCTETVADIDWYSSCLEPDHPVRETERAQVVLLCILITWHAVNGKSMSAPSVGELINFGRGGGSRQGRINIPGHAVKREYDNNSAKNLLKIPRSRS